MTELRQAAREIATRLRDAGHVALFAGGAVRDGLRRLEPKDIDIATSATPAQILELFPKGNSVGAHFGVILVRLRSFPFEIATFREDGEYRDGRHPVDVCFSSPEKDALRRDFTINGLFENPWTGEIIDYVGGRDDLEKHLVRAIGEPSQRFQEDSLRLMRAVRFSAVTGFEIEGETWAALCAHSEWLSRVSIERIREEFMKILVSPGRARGLDMLMDSGLMRHIIPEMYSLRGCEQPPQWHPEGDVYVHTRLMLEMLGDNPDPSLALSVLLHDIGKPPTFAVEDSGRIRFSGHDAVGTVMTEEILRRLKYPNATIEEVTAMVANHMKFMHVQDMRASRLRRFMSRPTFSREMELHRVDCASSNGFMDNYEFLSDKLEEYSSEPIMPPPLVTGRDIFGMGVEPGPRFREWLEAVQTEQLENRVTTREDALAFLHQLIENDKREVPQDDR